MTLQLVLFGMDATVDAPNSTLDIRRARFNTRAHATREYQRRSDDINRTVLGDRSGELEMLCSINNDDPTIPDEGSEYTMTINHSSMPSPHEIKLVLVSKEWIGNITDPLSEQRLVLRYHFNADTDAELLTDA